MKNRGNILPPLDYFLAFEAAAKFQSFVAASNELNISESAISRKVRLLELHYGVPMFVRGHRSISLTPQGRALLENVSDAMQSLREASKELLSGQSRNTVTLAATNSVASLWLMPRLRMFNRRNRQLQIMLVASDDDEQCLADNVDLAILRGNGTWPNFRATFLFGEDVFPVCSPEYLRRRGAISSVQDLANHALIEVSNAHSEWLNWRTWTREVGVEALDLSQPVVFNTYPLAIQATREGLGVGLGWRHLVDRHLESGQLVKPLRNTSVRTDAGYYLLAHDRQDAFAERNTVEDWLIGIAG